MRLWIAVLLKIKFLEYSVKFADILVKRTCFNIYLYFVFYEEWIKENINANLSCEKVKVISLLTFSDLDSDLVSI